MNCSFSSNPPEDDPAVCVYISHQYQETLATSTLVITQAGKQVVPRLAGLGQPEFTWLGSCFDSCRITTPCHHSSSGTSKWLPFLHSQWVITPDACTLPRVTEVSTGDLSPRQPRWTNQGKPAQIISSLNTLRHLTLKESNTTAVCSRT